MRKLIIVLIALLSVAALAPALGAPLINGGTPVYAHSGHTACTGGVTAAVEADLIEVGPGQGIGAQTSGFAKQGVISGAVATLHGLLCD